MQDKNKKKKKKEPTLAERVYNVYSNAARKGYLGDRARITEETKKKKKQKKEY